MPSPFPGMDPFLESQEWEDFHTTFNTVMRERLSAGLEPDYLVRVERRVYVEQVSEDPGTMRRADVAVLSMDSGPAFGRTGTDTSGAAVAVECEVPAIPIPLKRGDADIMLPLQEVFETVYQQARYDLSVNYNSPLDPPFSSEEADWLKQLRQSK